MKGGRGTVDYGRRGSIGCERGKEGRITVDDGSDIADDGFELEEDDPQGCRQNRPQTGQWGEGVGLYFLKKTMIFFLERK